ncbi:unnamed protein product [Orchesella dallaii]|uniref:Protein kinase domain-containing protein n=1 Tax=Orchesella dallaii TaxID=48710 RepID=A0ABP1QXH4_9HEXA
MPRTYVDNAYNRSAGRVGMTHGSAVISRSSGGGGGSYSSGGSGSSSFGGGSSSSSRTYVDNAYNRSAGRVGLEVGTAVISRSSSGGGGDSSKTYVDNAYNRNAGRVGLELGSAVISRSSSGSGGGVQPSSKTYVDNEYNRKAGRVGLPFGSAVISKSATSGTTSGGGGYGSAGGTPKTYTDNAYNRRLGRVGKPLGTASVSSASKSSTSASKTYVDNAMNRRLGRVGKEVGTAVFSRSNNSRMATKLAERPQVLQKLYDFDPEDPCVQDIYLYIEQFKEEHRDEPESVKDCEVAEGILHRHDAALAQSRANLKRPTWLLGGEVIEWEDLEIGEKLGGGGFGDVHAAIWKGEYQVAVKKLRVQRVHQKKKVQFEQEVQVFSNLHHEAIVEFYGACVVTPNIAIVMEFMPEGSLHDVLHVEGRQVTLANKFQMGEDILSALAYIHDLNIVHRDIKSMNVFVCEGLSHCKLGDFGLALKDEHQSSISVADYSVVGTVRYSAPEMIRGERLTKEQLMAADVYAAALTINELFLEEIPFEGLNQFQVQKRILDGERPEAGEGTDAPQVPELVGQLLKKGLSGSATERPSAANFLKQFRAYKIRDNLGALYGIAKNLKVVK